MSTETELFSFRPYKPDDVPFIHSSWGTSYYEGNPGHKQQNSDEFHSYHLPIRNKVLNNPKATAIVCAANNDQDTILGWILVEKNEDPYIKLHYIYVKGALQGNGIAKQLIHMALPIRPVLYTHSTQKWRRIMKENWKANKNDYDRFFFCPHLI